MIGCPRQTVYPLDCQGLRYGKRPRWKIQSHRGGALVTAQARGRSAV